MSPGGVRQVVSPPLSKVGGVFMFFCIGTVDFFFFLFLSLFYGMRSEREEQ